MPNSEEMYAPYGVFLEIVPVPVISPQLINNKPTTNTEVADKAEILANCTLTQHMQFESYSQLMVEFECKLSDIPAIPDS